MSKLMTAKQTKKTIRSFVLSLILLLIIIEIFALFSLWSINKIVQIENQKLHRISVMYESVSAADGAFKQQIQAWKNILIRGHERSDLQKYTEEFKKKYSITQTLINEANDVCNQMDDAGAFDCEKITKMQNDHEQLRNIYLDNLNALNSFQDGVYKKLDEKVRGIDRDLQNHFFQTSQSVRILYKNQQNEFISLVDKRYHQVRFFLLTILLFALGYLIIRFYILLKRDSNET